MVCVTEITHPTAVMSFLSGVTDWSIKTKQCYIFPATKGKETQIHNLLSEITKAAVGKLGVSC